MEYTLRSGKVVTDEQIEAMAEAIEAGSLPGQWSGEGVVGRPRLPPIQFRSARTTPPLSARRVPTKSTRLSSHTCS